MRTFIFLIAVACCSGVFGETVLPTPDLFSRDVTALTSAPHRIAGSPEGQAAGLYLEQRLREMGIKEVYSLDVPVWLPTTTRCDITIQDSAKISLVPLCPNLTTSPVTDMAGLTGSLLYVGNGELWEYGTRNPAGAIVVMEYNSLDNWRRAFAMGAQAIVFLGSEAARSPTPRHINLPANLVRLYASELAQSQFNFRLDYPRATVVSHQSWKRSVGRNIIAYLPGTNAQFAADEAPRREMMVISAQYDSYGEVPEITQGTRSAANAAAVLDAARYFQSNRPRRDILIAFVDNQKNYHEGMRNLYEAIMFKPELLDKLAKGHASELAFTTKIATDLSNPEKLLAGTPSKEVQRLFKSDAEHFAVEANQELMQLRMYITTTKSQDPELEAKAAAFNATYDKWNKAREAISNAQFKNIEKSFFNALISTAKARVQSRLNELKQLTESDKQSIILNSKFNTAFIVLHTAYNFSDNGSAWGALVGDATEYTFQDQVNPSTDNPGHYSRIFRAFRDALKKTHSLKKVHPFGFDDPTNVAQYVPGSFVAGNSVAGVYGIYNLAFMTYHDARIFDAQPGDNNRNINTTAIALQAHEATQLVGSLASMQSISLNRVIPDQVQQMYPHWDAGKTNGFSASYSVSGSISESQPAAGAAVAIMPTGLRWNLHKMSVIVPGYNYYVLEHVDANGRFKLGGVSKVLFSKEDLTSGVLGTMFDSLGSITAITNRSTLDKINGMTLFPCKGYVAGVAFGGSMLNGVALQSGADAPFRPDQACWDSEDNFAFFNLHRNTSINGIKLFQPSGTVMLNIAEGKPYGSGYPLSFFKTPPAVDSITAADLWRLNETRLSILRNKGVTNVDLELIQNRAQQLIGAAEAKPALAQKLAKLSQSAAFSRLIYLPIKQVMNDLISAVVILLLLSIPFAFALERLLIGATTIYGRLGGFAIIFIVTFACMYFMHPGFQIASAPLIVFLAFAIILLASLVIFIMMRKFRTEIMAFQGKSSSMHSAEISKIGTLVAAVNMGMSTMRRRPWRTALTCITVIMLTFTVLCFASLSSRLGIRSFYMGAVADNIPANFLIHNLDFSEINPNLGQILKGREGDSGTICEHWWVTKRKRASGQPLYCDRPFGIARPESKKDAFVNGIMGVSPSEITLWPRLHEALSTDSAHKVIDLLHKGGVFLPPIIQEQLDLKPGDPIIIRGEKAFFAGAINIGVMQRLKSLDGKSVMPVDFMDVSYAAAKPQEVSGAGATASSTANKQGSKDFIRLNPNALAVCSSEKARSLGARLHLLTIYADKSISTAQESDRLAELASMPVWTQSKEGIERKVFLKLTEMSGIWALIIPVLLGGLIIFGTLLGSITDRQKEIYTFSALGLSPGHVGFLFFAEATVYAVIGGLGGQLLAQALALVATFLANQGYIQPVNINFSSTNSLFAIGVVMATVLVSSIYPAIRASKSANPGVARAWKMPVPKGDVLSMKFPFTVSTYDITGVVSFLAEWFKEHDDAGLGLFASEKVRISRSVNGNIQLQAQLSLAPFDLGITQDFTLTAAPSEIPGIDEVLITAVRLNGSPSDWHRAQRTFIHALRKQFLLWRTLTSDVIENYRMDTLQYLGEAAVEES